MSDIDGRARRDDNNNHRHDLAVPQRPASLMRLATLAIKPLVSLVRVPFFHAAIWLVM
ncbi:MAG: hypothetical protein R3E66_02280 [bacterium]